MINYDQLVCQALPTVLKTSRQLQEASAWIGSDESDVKSSTWPGGPSKRGAFQEVLCEDAWTSWNWRTFLQFAWPSGIELLLWASGGGIVRNCWRCGCNSMGGNMRGRHLAQLKRFQPFDHLCSFCYVCRSLQVDNEELWRDENSWNLIVAAQRCWTAKSFGWSCAGRKTDQLNPALNPVFLLPTYSGLFRSCFLCFCILLRWKVLSPSKHAFLCLECRPLALFVVVVVVVIVVLSWW